MTGDDPALPSPWAQVRSALATAVENWRLRRDERDDDGDLMTQIEDRKWVPVADRLDFHIYVHVVHEDASERVTAKLDRILTQGERLLMASKDMLDALDKIDQATNAVADEISTLKSQVGTGMSQADVDAVQARLDAAATKLQGIAANPENPVPAE